MEHIIKKFTKLFILYFTGVFLVFNGCNSEEGTKEEFANSAAKISITDFQNVVTTDISMTEMNNTKIHEIDEFYDNVPQGTQDSADVCMDNLLIEHNIVYEKDTGDTYKILMNDIDFKNCITSDPGLTLNSAIGSLVMEKVKIIDANGNIVNPEGKSLLDLKNTSLKQGIFKSYFYFNATGTISGNTVTISSTMKKIKSSDVDPTQPCLWTINSFENDCTIYQLSAMEYSDPKYQGEIELIKLTARNGLGKSDTGVYFTNGTIDINYNNWSGSVTYDGDPSTPPTYTLSDGGNALNGIF